MDNVEVGVMPAAPHKALKKKSGIKNSLIILGLMGLCFFISSIGLWNTIPFNTTQDEFGGIIFAALLAGKDWSALTSSMSYYGFGWYGLFFWVFKITNDPYLIYRIIVLCTVAFRTLIIPMSYRIITRYLKVDDNILAYLLAFMCPFLSPNVMGMIYNENPMSVILWAAVLFYMEFYYEEKIRGLVISLFCGFYILLIHTRGISLTIAICMALCLKCITSKKIKSLIAVVLATGGGYVLSKLLISYVQSLLYDSGRAVPNSSISDVIAEPVSVLELKTWIVWFQMIMSHITSEYVVSAGLFVIAVGTLFRYLYVYKFKILKEPIWNLMLIPVIGMGICFAGLIVSSWAHGINALWGNIADGIWYSFKGITYIRYWAVWSPPFLLAGCYDFIKNTKSKNARLLIWSFLIVNDFILVVLPYIENNPSAAYCWYITGISKHTVSSTVDRTFYFNAILISTIVFVVGVLIKKFKGGKFFVILMCCFGIVRIVNVNTNYDISVKYHSEAMINATYNAYNRLQREGYNIDRVYFYDSISTGNWAKCYIGQFYLNEIEVRTELPEELDTNEVIVSTCANLDDVYPELNRYRMDRNEYWYTYFSEDELGITLFRHYNAERAIKDAYLEAMENGEEFDATLIPDIDFDVFGDDDDETIDPDEQAATGDVSINDEEGAAAATSEVESSDSEGEVAVDDVIPGGQDDSSSEQVVPEENTGSDA